MNRNLDYPSHTPGRRRGFLGRSWCSWKRTGGVLEVPGGVLHRSLHDFGECSMRNYSQVCTKLDLGLVELARSTGDLVQLVRFRFGPTSLGQVESGLVQVRSRPGTVARQKVHARKKVAMQTKKVAMQESGRKLPCKNCTAGKWQFVAVQFLRCSKKSCTAIFAPELFKKYPAISFSPIAFS